MEPYYYSQMNKVQQSVYHSMKAGLLECVSSFLVIRLEGRELQEIFLKLHLDCPEIFYAGSFRYRFKEDAAKVEIIPEYLFDKKKIKEHQKAMMTRIVKVIRPAKAMTEWEKEKYIHDFICANVHYDKLKKAYSHEIIGPLGQGVGVCEGIAKTVKVLCDALDIWCIVVISEANPDKNIKYRHAWNVVKIAGQYYHMDATFDNNLGGEEIIRYDYFNRSDKYIFRDHENVIYQIPQCHTDEYFYYKEKKLSFTKMEEVSKRAIQAIRKKKPFVFHWRGGTPTREILSQLLMVLEDCARQKEIHSVITINRSQMVIQVKFVPKEQTEEVLFEESSADGVIRQKRI
jgi:Transglutaminase-like superfamily.